MFSEKKSKILSEYKKVKDIPGIRKKAGYIWAYYYIWIILASAVIILGIYGYIHRRTLIGENWIYITFANTYADVGNGSDIWNDFVDETGYDIHKKNVMFNNTSYFDYGKSLVGNSYFEMFVAYTEAGTLDAITMETDSLVKVGESGRLMDLNSEKCAQIREKYGKRMIYCKAYDEDYSKDPVPVGIDITDSIIMTRYHAYSGKCAIGIGANSKHIDAVLKFLDFILKEE